MKNYIHHFLGFDFRRLAMFSNPKIPKNGKFCFFVLIINTLIITITDYCSLVRELVLNKNKFAKEITNRKLQCKETKDIAFIQIWNLTSPGQI